MSLANAGKWTELNPALSVASLRAIASLGFVEMTPVQAATIPLFMSNKDVSVEAVTGSGKTVAFLVPMLEILLRREDKLKKHDVGAIVLTPTRELAVQIHSVAEYFFPPNGLSTLLVMGGGAADDDFRAFREKGGHVLIATPGRLEQLLGQPEVNVKTLDVLVLDEADRLLQLGFEMSLNAILARLPKQRRTGLFSATQTTEVKELVRAGLRNPVQVQVRTDRKAKAAPAAAAAAAAAAPAATPATLRNLYTTVPLERKLDQLAAFLAQHRRSKCIVFMLTCACVDFVYKVLARVPKLQSIALYSLHGRAPHAKRLATFEKFLAEPHGVLLATDVAARGLDFPAVDWIVQFDPPQDPAQFVHRVGRTARMGRTGSAVLYLTPYEQTYLEYLRTKSIALTELSAVDDAPDTAALARRLAAADRELLERGQRAFVSYIRAYQEHKLSFIFRLERVPIAQLARLFGLLRIPAMPEIKGPVPDFVPSEIDPDSVPYADATRERQRQERLQRKAAARAARAASTAPAAAAAAAAAGTAAAGAARTGRHDSDRSGSESDDSVRGTSSSAEGRGAAPPRSAGSRAAGVEPGEWSGQRARQQKRRQREQKRLRKLMAGDASDEAKEQHLLRRLKAGRITLEQFERLKREMGIGSRGGAESTSEADTDSDAAVDSRGRLRKRRAAGGARARSRSPDSGSASEAVASSDGDDEGDADGGAAVTAVERVRLMCGGGGGDSAAPDAAAAAAALFAAATPAVKALPASAGGAGGAAPSAVPTRSAVQASLVAVSDVPAAPVRTASTFGDKRKRKQKHAVNHLPFSKRA